jgi:hypothetical protein
LETQSVRTWAFRGVLLLTVLASLVVRFQGLRSLATFDVDSAVREVVLDSGFALRENPAQPPKALSRAVYFQRPECGRASMVMPYTLTSELLPFLAQAIEPGYARRFFYLDKSWGNPSRSAMFFEWAKNVFLGLFRKQRFFTQGMAILVAEPVDCNPTNSIDWRQVWDKERPVSPQTTRAPSENSKPGLTAGSN